MFWSEIKWCYSIFGCVLCSLYSLDVLTCYTLLTSIACVGVVHYYIRKRDENFRHRLSVLGLVKHDKRERKINSPRLYNSAYANNCKDGSALSPRRVSISFSFAQSPRTEISADGGLSLSASSNPDKSHNYSGSVSFYNNTNVERSHRRLSGYRNARRSGIKWEPASPKRHPYQQDKYCIGSYPTVHLSGSPLPTAKAFAAQDGTTPVKVKILPLASSPKQQRLYSYQVADSHSEASKKDPCSTEAVLKALKERRKRAAVPSQEEVDNGDGNKRQKRESRSLSPLVPVLPPPYCPATSPFGARGRTAEKRPRSCAPESPGETPKRLRNNAILSSFCSSRSLLEASQTQKRKASTCGASSPQSKVTRRDERTSPATTGDQRESDAVQEEATRSPLEQTTAPKVATTPAQVTKDAGVPSPEKSTSQLDQIVHKRRLVFPEHIATMEEHEQDRLLEKRKLDLMLSTVKDLYQSSRKENTPPVATVPLSKADSGAVQTTSAPSQLHAAPTVPVTSQGTGLVPALLPKTEAAKQETITTVPTATVAAAITTTSAGFFTTTTTSASGVIVTPAPVLTFDKIPNIGASALSKPSLPTTTATSSSLLFPSAVTPPAFAVSTAASSTSFATPAVSSPSFSLAPSTTNNAASQPAFSSAIFTQSSTSAPQTAMTSKDPVFGGATTSPSVTTALFSFGTQPVPSTKLSPIQPAGTTSASPFNLQQAPSQTTAPPACSGFGRTFSTLTVTSAGAKPMPTFTGPHVTSAPFLPTTTSTTPTTTPTSFQLPGGFKFSSSTPATIASSAQSPGGFKFPSTTPTTTTSSIQSPGGFKFPSTNPATAAPNSQSPGGFKFPAATTTPCGFSFGVHTGSTLKQPSSSIVSNGINGINGQTGTEPQAHGTSTPVFKFGSTSNTPAFNFAAQVPSASKPNTNFTSAPSPPMFTAGGANMNSGSLFSIGSATRSERTMAVPRSRRSARK